MESVMLERTMLSLIKKKLKPMNCELTNIETGGVSIGVPDWYLKTQIYDIWIEAKELKRWPVRDGTKIKIDFRPGQYPWIVKHQRLEAKVLLLVTYKEEWYCYKKIRREYTQLEWEMLSVFPTNLMEYSSARVLQFFNSWP